MGLELVSFSFQSVGTFRRGNFSYLLLIRNKFPFSFSSIGLPTRWMTSVDGIVVVSGFVFSCGSFFSLWRCLLFFLQPPSSYLSPSPDSNLSRISLQKQSFFLGLSAHCKRKLQHFVCLFWFEKKFFHVFCTFVTTLAPSNFFEEEKKLRKVTNNLDLEQKESQTNHKTMF